MKRWLIYSAPILGLILVIALAWFIWFADRTATKAYSSEWSAALVIDFMEANENAWPRSWEDLRVHYDNAKGSPPSFEDLQKFIKIDWTADPTALQKVAEGPAEEWDKVRVIRLSDGSRTHWQGGEPNGAILAYLGGQPRM